MYNMIFPINPDRCGAILGLLGFAKPDEVGRFRDAWVEKDSDGKTPIFAVYTRNGGGNREDQAEAITRMQEHPLYLRDADDEFDYTYATFYFRTPEGILEDVDPNDLQDHVDTSQRWLDALDAMKQQ